MRVISIGLLSVAVTLSGCNARDDAIGGSGNRKGQGRYAGIGTYPADSLWKEAVDAPAPKDPAAAKLEDDAQIIVVIDSHTGEVRQCGNHSGFCVTMDPWARAGAQTGAPIRLKKHAADLAAGEQAAATEAAPAANEAAPAR